MKSTILSAAGLALLGAAHAGVIDSRQAGFRFECNGKQNPDTSDCDEVYALFSDPTQTFTAPAANPQGQNGIFYDVGTSKNCRVVIYWDDRSYTVTGNQVYNGIDGVRYTCFSQNTGGRAVDVGGRFSIEVINNPDYIASKAKRDGPEVIPMGRAIERERMTSVLIPETLEKRADDDTGFTFGVHTTYATPPELRQNVDVGLGGESTWTWSEDKSVTQGTSFSVEVSAGIEGMLSTTLGTEISSSTTTTSGTAQTMNVRCDDDQVGQVYFQAYAEIWRGTLQPSGEPLTITKPMTVNGKTDGYYQWECSNT